MLYSMTGFGDAQYETEDMSFLVEIKSLNNRFLKTTIRLSEALSFAEPHIERMIRQKLGRGSVTCVVHMRYNSEEGAMPVNQAALNAYLRQLREAVSQQADGLGLRINAATLLTMPGVCQPRDYSEQEHAKLLDTVLGLVEKSLEKLRKMQANEGKALRSDLDCHCETIRHNLEALSDLTASVVERYHDRLKQRVENMLAKASLKIDEDMLAREVAIFADRCDINEEIARLGSHLDQFAQACESKAQEGRRLDFLTQEMLRETNTIGSKANDSQISQHIVNIKVAIDRLKEQIQNVE